MGANGHDPAPAPEAAATPPVIRLTFKGVGVADFDIAMAGVTPPQLYAAAFYLSEMARSIFAGNLQAQAAGGLVRAGASVMDDLRRSGRV